MIGSVPTDASRHATINPTLGGGRLFEPNQDVMTWRGFRQSLHVIASEAKQSRGHAGSLDCVVRKCSLEINKETTRKVLAFLAVANVAPKETLILS
jgi:hypothetical protein